MKHYLLTALLLIFLSLPSFAQLSCDNIDEICQKAARLINEGKYETALNGLFSAKSDPGIRNCSDVYKIDNLILKIQEKEQSISAQEELSCPDSNHPHLIDLSLPSRTKWACCNVGASRPEDYGGYYAWGETTTKNFYDWLTYKWCRGGKKELKKIMKYCTQKNYGKVDYKTVLDAYDDAARMNWYSSWLIPTLAQIQELLDNCKHFFTTVNGVSGIKFTGSNGASIFLPASGWRQGDYLDNKNRSGYYWSSTLDESDQSCAHELYFNFISESAFCFGSNRRWGQSVRPVSSE